MDIFTVDKQFTKCFHHKMKPVNLPDNEGEIRTKCSLLLSFQPPGTSDKEKNSKVHTSQFLRTFLFWV